MCTVIVGRPASPGMLLIAPSVDLPSRRRHPSCIRAGVVLADILSAGNTMKGETVKYVKWIAHKDKEILFMDAAGTSAAEGMAAWEEMRQELSKERDVRLILIDGTNAKMDKGTLQKAKGVVDVAKKKPGTPVACVGMNDGFQKTMAQLMATRLRLNAHFCANLEEGKNWLVTEDERRR